MSARIHLSCKGQGHSDLYFHVFCCKTLRSIEAKFHIALLWVGRMKVCSNGPGHMTKVAATPIYGKKTLNIFFAETGRPITYELGLRPQRLGLYNGCSNNDLRWTLIYFTASSILLPNAFIWENA